MVIFRPRPFLSVIFSNSFCPVSGEVRNKIRNAFFQIPTEDKKCQRKDTSGKKCKKQKIHNCRITQDAAQNRQKLYISAAEHAKIMQRKETDQRKKETGKKVQDSPWARVENPEEKTCAKSQADQPVIHLFL